VSYLHTRQQDIQEARSELRTLIQRLDRIPIENTEEMNKYADDAGMRASISALFNNENSMAAQQASDIIDRIPGNVGAAEYLNIANALIQSGISDKALKLYPKGLKIANDANDEVNLLRSYGYMLIATGDPENGRAQYRTALNIFQKYPTSNSYMIESYHFMTEKGWANAEALIHQCGYARSHVAQAEIHLTALAPGSMTDQYRAQLNQVRQQLDINCKQ
jgi:tetratricopeptide (TPR) repeat protein